MSLLLLFDDFLFPTSVNHFKLKINCTIFHYSSSASFFFFFWLSGQYVSDILLSYAVRCIFCMYIACQHGSHNCAM